MSLCQTQVMLLTPLLKQALNEQPLLVLLWVVFVDFHNPYNHPVIRAALVARLVKNLPAMRETWVRSLGWEEPLDPPGSAVPGILQARTLEWVAISFSRESSRPRDRTQVSRIVDRRFTICATRSCSRTHVQIPG